MYVVEHDWHSVAGCFSQTYIPWDHAVEYLGTEETSQVGGYLLGQGGAVVVHRQQYPLDRKRWIDGATKTSERVEKFRDALES